MLQLGDVEDNARVVARSLTTLLASLKLALFEALTYLFSLFEFCSQNVVASHLAFLSAFNVEIGVLIE